MRDKLNEEDKDKQNPNLYAVVKDQIKNGAGVYMINAMLDLNADLVKESYFEVTKKPRCNSLMQ